MRPIVSKAILAAIDQHAGSFEHLRTFMRNVALESLDSLSDRTRAGLDLVLELEHVRLALPIAFLIPIRPL